MRKQAPHNARSDADLLEWLRAEHAQPFEGWDFSYLTGRRVEAAHHHRWDLHEFIGAVWVESHSILDVETGGGERMAEWIAAFGRKELMAAVEAYPPNVPVARRMLEPLGVQVVKAAAASIPFLDASFDLITNRHGHLAAAEVLRLLRPGGRLVTQQMGSDTNREIRRWFGRAVAGERWDLGAARAQAESAGLAVEHAAEAFYTTWFLDAGAMAYYLKAVPWDVPDFEIDRYAERLLALHRHIQSEGSFETTIHQFLLVARRRVAS